MKSFEEYVEPFLSEPGVKLGSQLPASTQREAISSFVNRYTGENTPPWTRDRRANGEPYPVQFLDDADWLAHTIFHVTKSDGLDPRFSSCFSLPTWPNNPELRKYQYFHSSTIR